MPTSLFVAFAQQDATYANALILALRNAGYLVATDDGSQGSSTSSLLNQLVQGDAFVLLLSPATHDDPRAIAASNLAYSLWLQGTVQHFIPVVATPLTPTDLGGLLYGGDMPSGDEFLARFDLLDGADTPENVTGRIGLAIADSAKNDANRRSRATNTISTFKESAGEIITGTRDVGGVESAEPAPGTTTIPREQSGWIERSPDTAAPPVAGDVSPDKQAQVDQPQAPASSDADDNTPLDLLQAVSEDEKRADAYAEPVDQEERERAVSTPPSPVEESPVSGKPKPADAVTPPDLADRRAQEPVPSTPPPDGTTTQAPPANIGAPPPPPPASVAAPMAPPRPPPEELGYAQPPAPGAPPAAPDPSQTGYNEPAQAWGQTAQAQPSSAPYAPPGSAPGSPAAYAPPPAPARHREKAKESPAAEAGPALDVACTAYYPKEVVAQKWESLLVYLALDKPETLAAVAADAAERLVRQADRFRPASASGQSRLRKGAKLTIVPMLPGFEANPTSITTRWEEDVQRHEFRFRATTAVPGQATNGYVSIFAGGLLFAEIPLSIFVQQATGRIDIPGGFASQVVRAYRKVFASYSHADTDIVRMCRAAAEATGDRYLMDITLLRSGQQWNDALLEAIAEADLFQLFWSKAAAASEHVANEWRYALQLLPNRSGFIRPVYWSPELYPLPPELAPIHFERLDLVKLGWVRPQPFWRALFGRA